MYFYVHILTTKVRASTALVATFPWQKMALNIKFPTFHVQPLSPHNSFPSEGGARVLYKTANSWRAEHSRSFSSFLTEKGRLDLRREANVEFHLVAISPLTAY